MTTPKPSPGPYSVIPAMDTESNFWKGFWNDDNEPSFDIPEPDPFGMTYASMVQDLRDQSEAMRIASPVPPALERWYRDGPEPDPTPEQQLAEFTDGWEYVYRIENSRHKGAYQTYSGHIWKEDQDRHPSPGRDGLGWIDSRYHFGFSSMAQLKAWFGPHELNCLTLHNRDCCLDSTLGDNMGRWDNPQDLLEGVQQLVLLRVPSRHIRHGSKQVCFNDQYADRIMALPLDRDLIGLL